MSGTNRVWRALVAAVTLTGCMNGPVGGAEIESIDTPVRFQGLAQAPEAPIQIKAWDYVAKEYVTIGTTTSASEPVAFGGYQVYPWYIDATIAQDSAPTLGRCRWTNYCGPSRRLAKEARVRAFQGLGSAEIPLPAFSSREMLHCYLENIDDAGDVLLAFGACAPTEPYEVRLRVIGS